MAARNPLFLRDEELDRSLELLLLAERDILGRAEDALAAFGISDTDFRILYLVQRHPGTTVADLAAVLGRAKQSLSRHVKHLVALGLLRQEGLDADRRKRALVVTANAANAIAAVGALHKRGLRRAFKSAGPEAVEGFQRVLSELIDGPARRLVGRSPV